MRPIAHLVAAVAAMTLLGADALAASVTCQSRNNQREECWLQGRGEVVLVRQISKTTCVKGRNWDETRDGIYVTDGCGGVFETRGDYRDLLTSRETFVDPLLAIVYRVPAPNLEGFGRVTLPVESRRRGLLGQASILALHSHAVTTSATLRGLFVRETLLCGEIPDPPPGVVTVIPEATGDTPTLRDRVAIHLQDPVCSSCHALMDPIGLSLEQFDAIGQFRTEEGGAVIDASGTWLGRRFEDAADMTERLRNDPAFLACFPRTVFRYAMGRLDTPADEVTLEELEADFASQEYRVLDLFRAVATHPSFRVFSPNGGNP